MCLIRASVLWFFVITNFAVADDVVDDENRPYEFQFNIVDFQHRYEKKDKNGIITGEYGFITADGVYHETGYATDKNGDFLITKMRNRKITSLKDAQEIFKDKPEAAEKLVEAIAQACSSCKLAVKPDKKNDTVKVPTKEEENKMQKQIAPVLQEMMKVLVEQTNPENQTVTTEKNEIPKEIKKIDQNQNLITDNFDEKKQTKEIIKEMVDSAKKTLSKNDVNDPRSGKSFLDDRALEKMANDLYYQFNYTITSHGHHEDGYRSGTKDGSYRAPNENGVDTQVKYLSNEFGHQPNITLVHRENTTDEEHKLKGYSFVWYWQ